VSRLTELIAQAKAKDPSLGAELEKEIRTLANRRSFGLNFERHRPESVELPGRPIRKGDKVRILPPRGETRKGDQRLWKVLAVRREDGRRLADLVTIHEAEAEQAVVLTDDLVVVAEFKDYIYPGLVSTGRVERGGDKPFHTVINGENFHALEALTFTHRGKVDAIYIDPPYNSGASDWKYNNNYVGEDDLYRHSKWLAFMERRLLVAKELLRKESSTLIVTIDEKEHLRLGLLLQQLFPDGRIQMVSTVINRKGNARRGEFARCEEYLYFVRFGEVNVPAWQTDMLGDGDSEKKSVDVRWKSLLRLASTGQTSGRFNLFFPLFFNAETLEFAHAGNPIPDGVDIETVPTPEGLSVLWPISKDGSDGRWSLSLPKFNEYMKLGYVKFGGKNGGGRTPYYLMSGQIAAIESGELLVSGRDQDGAVVVESLVEQKQPKTIWNLSSHSTSGHGTSLLRDMIPGRKFPYPKSVYAVEDALRFAVGARTDGIVLDFFSGSGTTAHAIMRLNRQDGGRRQCISVTNNEVAADEHTALRRAGLRPGDPDWEKWGICDYITKPRIAAAITGKTPDGKNIEGDYKFIDEFPMAEGFEENAEFFTLTYETPVAVSHNRAFERIAPLLWMRAGSKGKRIDDLPFDGWAVADTYGLLTDLDMAGPFCAAVSAEGDISVAFIVTDDERRFQAVARQLPKGVDPVRLYESYLTNFRFSMGR
jgi:adenine-specific DNA-methyltransferase